MVMLCRVATSTDAPKLLWPGGWPQLFLEAVHILIFHYLTKIGAATPNHLKPTHHGDQAPLKMQLQGVRRGLAGQGPQEADCDWNLSAPQPLRHIAELKESTRKQQYLIGLSHLIFLRAATVTVSPAPERTGQA